MSALATVGGPWLLLWRTLAATARRGVSWREWLRQLLDVGVRTSGLIVAGQTFFGVVMVTIAYHQARKFTGNVTTVGPAYFELLVRELGPLTCAMLTAARAGAASAAELASMKVNEQIEALEMCAGDPLADLVAPRVLASLVAIPLLTVLGIVAAALGASLTVTLAFGADGRMYVDPRFLDVSDLACTALKTVLCGLFVPAAAAYRGLRATGGAPAVGDAVTRGVIDACIGCLVIDFLVAALFLLGGA